MDRLPTATTSLVFDVGTWLANREAILPVPMMPQRSVWSVKRDPVVGFVVSGQNFMAPAARSAMNERAPIRKTPIRGMTLINAPAITIE
ncbi:hypothetical protein GCM10010530_62750 [Kribbella aluminosa]